MAEKPFSSTPEKNCNKYIQIALLIIIFSTAPIMFKKLYRTNVLLINLDNKKYYVT